jgi:serine/threonine-protein kinase
MAPEQLSSGPIDVRADIYALGVVLFEMVTGELPFGGETPLEAAVKRLECPAPSARSRVRNLPAAWDRTIRACLARDPGRRPASVLSVLRMLEEGASRDRRARAGPRPGTGPSPAVRAS